MREPSFSVELLQIPEIDAYLDLMRVVDAGSGVDGAPHWHPYEVDEPFDNVAAHKRELTRWSTPTREIGWRRAWGLRDGGTLVGFLYLAGGALRTELHRVDLGMGVRSSHRRLGGGGLLLEAAIRWAELQPNISWIDLGVFSDNHTARALYARAGFVERGHTPDRFRVDGHSLDDVSMTRHVS